MCTFSTIRNCLIVGVAITVVVVVGVVGVVVTVVIFTISATDAIIRRARRWQSVSCSSARPLSF